jgi:hypothetical protein
LVCEEIYCDVFFLIILILETPSTTDSPPLSSNKPESINNEDLSQPDLTKTKEDEVTIDDDDDDAMFDEEEFETVIFRFRKPISGKFSFEYFSLTHFHPQHPQYLILK